MLNLSVGYGFNLNGKENNATPTVYDADTNKVVTDFIPNASDVVLTDVFKLENATVTDDMKVTASVYEKGTITAIVANDGTPLTDISLTQTFFDTKNGYGVVQFVGGALKANGAYDVTITVKNSDDTVIATSTASVDKSVPNVKLFKAIKNGTSDTAIMNYGSYVDDTTNTFTFIEGISSDIKYILGGDIDSTTVDEDIANSYLNYIGGSGQKNSTYYHPYVEVNLTAGKSYTVYYFGRRSVYGGKTAVAYLSSGAPTIDDTTIDGASFSFENSGNEIAANADSSTKMYSMSHTFTAENDYDRITFHTDDTWLPDLVAVAVVEN